jgi:subtilisin family serine protease
MEDAAVAIIETVDAGACALNLSVALAEPASRTERRMMDALDYAADRGVIVVAAAGNRATLGSSPITRHPWVVPVTACDLQGRPMPDTTLSHSAGKRGVAAPGDGVVSAAPGGSLESFAGTSAATPFVTGTVALLKSMFPSATGGQLRVAITRSRVPRRTTVVPPLLDAEGAWRMMSQLKESVGT